MASNMYHLSPAAFQLHLFNETIKSMPKLRFPAKGLVGPGSDVPCKKNTI